VLDCLETSCFLVVCLRQYGVKGCPSSLGNCFYLTEVKDTVTCDFLVRRSWCLFALSLNSSEMGIKVITGKY
jgi:hypothetical protein